MNSFVKEARNRLNKWLIQRAKLLDNLDLVNKRREFSLARENFTPEDSVIYDFLSRPLDHWAQTAKTNLTPRRYLNLIKANERAGREGRLGDIVDHKIRYDRSDFGFDSGRIGRDLAREQEPTLAHFDYSQTGLRKAIAPVSGPPLTRGRLNTFFDRTRDPFKGEAYYAPSANLIMMNPARPGYKSVLEHERGHHMHHGSDRLTAHQNIRNHFFDALRLVKPDQRRDIYSRMVNDKSMINEIGAEYFGNASFKGPYADYLSKYVERKPSMAGEMKRKFFRAIDPNRERVDSWHEGMQHLRGRKFDYMPDYIDKSLYESRGTPATRKFWGHFGLNHSVHDPWRPTFYTTHKPGRFSQFQPQVTPAQPGAEFGRFGYNPLSAEEYKAIGGPTLSKI